MASFDLDEIWLCLGPTAFLVLIISDGEFVFYSRTITQALQSSTTRAQKGAVVRFPDPLFLKILSGQPGSLTLGSPLNYDHSMIHRLEHYK